MELVKDLINNNQLSLYIPVALVVFGAILVFAFGFRSAEQPAFNKLTSEDRKSLNKKKKIKDKKLPANGHIASGEVKSDKSPIKDVKRSPTKESDQKAKDKKSETNNKILEKNRKNEALKTKSGEELKNKKPTKKSSTEKPKDYDEGDWETVPSKGDKKKKQDSPAKKEKKPKKVEKNGETNKIEKEDTRDNEQEVVLRINKIEPIDVPVTVPEPVIVIEEAKDKKKEKKAKKDEVATKKEEVAPKMVHIELIVGSEEKEPEQPEVQSEIIESSLPAETKLVENKSGVAFDELGDTWTEAKVPKKSKKKARRDN